MVMLLYKFTFNPYFDTMSRKKLRFFVLFCIFHFNAFKTFNFFNNQKRGGFFLKSSKKYCVSLLVFLLIFSSIPWYGFAAETKYVTDVRQTTVGGDPSTLPENIPYTDENGYIGTLMATGPAYVISGSESAATSKTVKVTQTGYIEYTSSPDPNDGECYIVTGVTYNPDTIYYNQGGFTGTLHAIAQHGWYQIGDSGYEAWVTYQYNHNVPVDYEGVVNGNADTRVWKRDYSGIVSVPITKNVTEVRQTTVGGNPATLPDTIPYTDEDGFTGTLVATGPAYVVSGSLSETTSKTVSVTQTGYIEYISSPDPSDPECYIVTGVTYNPDTIYYNQGGFTGTLHAIAQHGRYQIGESGYEAWVTYQYNHNVPVDYEGVVNADTRVWKRDYSGVVTK
jgi:hypothetical protein